MNSETTSQISLKGAVRGVKKETAQNQVWVVVRIRPVVSLDEIPFGSENIEVKDNLIT